jgi:hypothetical protein
VTESFFRWHYSAVAEDGKFVAQCNLGDAYLAYPAGLHATIEDVIERCEDSIVLSRVRPQLCDCLCDEYVKPVETLWLVSLDIVVGFGQYGGDAGAARTEGIPYYGARGFVSERIGSGRVGPRS